MVTKTKKKRNSKDSTSSNVGSGDSESKKKKEIGKSGGKKKAVGSRSLGCDIFDDGVMENAYLICHNIQDVLKSRGFPWPDGPKKKKKGKR